MYSSLVTYVWVNNYWDIFIDTSDAKYAISYYTLSNGTQSILPAEAMEDRNPYPFGIDPVKIHTFMCLVCIFSL